MDGTHTGAVVLYYGFHEQARHEHMSDEYKDRYFIITLLKTSLVLHIIYENTLSPKYRTEQEGGPVKHN